MSTFDWEAHRRPDGSIDLLKAFKAANPEPGGGRRGAEYRTIYQKAALQFAAIERLKPISDPQIAAVALASVWRKQV